MKLTPPKRITWYIALVLAVLAFIGQVATLGVLSTYAFWLALVAAVLLLLATSMKGL